MEPKQNKGNERAPDESPDDLCFESICTACAEQIGFSSLIRGDTEKRQRIIEATAAIFARDYDIRMPQDAALIIIRRVFLRIADGEFGSVPPVPSATKEALRESVLRCASPPAEGESEHSAWLDPLAWDLSAELAPEDLDARRYALHLAARSVETQDRAIAEAQPSSIP